MGGLFRRIARSRFGPAFVLAALAASVCGTCAASAQQRGLEYETILLAPDEPADPALLEFVAAASDMLWRHASTIYGGRNPPSPAGGIFADSVSVYVGRRELARDDRFEKLGRFPRDAFLAFFGQFLEDKPIWRAGSEARGANAVNALLSETMVGPNDLLNSQICTGSFKRISHDEMIALLAATETSIDAWGVAQIPSGEAEVHRGAVPGDWVAGQLLYVDDDASPIRSCCWDYVVSPDGMGAYVQMGFGPGPLIPYLASHACFTRTEEGWRIAAVAIRL